MPALSKSIQKFFNQRPLIANSIIYGSLYVGAELSQQIVQRKIFAKPRRELDVATLARYGIMGTFVYSPILYNWYKWLDGKYQGKTTSVIVKKLLLDQFVITPILLVIFFVGMSLMEGADDPLAEMKKKFLVTFRNACYFWIPAQAVNFSTIPPKFRILYIGTCALVWINILCWIKRQGHSDSATKVK